jgi:hypothetical protein
MHSKKYCLYKQRVKKYIMTPSSIEPYIDDSLGAENFKKMQYTVLI